MPKLKLKKENKDGVEGWMGTYGDMVTLLMAFFVMLYSASDPDPGKYEEIVESMKEAFSKQDVENEFKKLHESLEDIIEKKNLENTVEIELGPNGILIQIPGSSLFASGSADIMTDMAPVIVEISTAITQLLDQSSYHDYMIEVEGHTDDEKLPPNADYPSNWELSAARSLNLVRFICKYAAMPEKYFSAMGYGEFRPIIDVKSISNIAEKEKARAVNRRVEIYLDAFIKQKINAENI